MVAGEEELLAIEKNRMPLRVSGSRNHQHLVIDKQRIESLRLHFHGSRATANVVAMENPLASEALMELLVVGDIILMRQQHFSDSA